MYNRYIPGTGGVYERRIMQEPKKDPPCPDPAPEPEPEPPCRETVPERREQSGPLGGPFQMDLGDLLLLCIILLLLIDDDGEDWTTILITAVAFLLLQ